MEQRITKRVMSVLSMIAEPVRVSKDDENCHGIDDEAYLDEDDVS